MLVFYRNTGGHVSFLSEMKRRNVFKVGIAYLALAWLMVEAASTMAPMMQLPDWAAPLVLYLLIIGFPIALFLAWVFEMTPEGLKRQKDIDGEGRLPQSSGRALDFIIIAALVITVGYLFYNQDARQVEVIDPSSTAQASIAVLPFVNISSDPEQEYFSDGITEEIMNVLVKIPELSVAGRTSSFSYKGHSQDLREIGQNLNVDHILEGSVRKAGTRLRITAQLVRSDDGFQLWSQTYDRELLDIFDIQDEISRAIAAALSVSLGLESGALLTDRTDDIEAYEKYLRAKQLYLMRGINNINLAVLLLNEVTTRDPNFAPAWSDLSRLYDIIGGYEQTVSSEIATQRHALARMTALRAIELNPNYDAAYAHLGSSLILSHDWIAAFEALDRALELTPNDPEILDLVSQELSGFGYLKEAEGLNARARALDPQRGMLWNTLSLISLGLGNADQFNMGLQRAHILNPALPWLPRNKIYFNLMVGNFEGATRYLEEAEAAGVPGHENWRIQFDALIAAKDDPAALRALRDQAKQVAPFEDFWIFVISSQLQDWDQLIDDLEPYVWDTNATYWPTTLVGRGAAANRPKWKEIVRRDGILALWQSRGFPAHCRALGEDDFECGLNEDSDE
jgi:TolB-like protein/Flp pilus assembly protein TadD